MVITAEQARKRSEGLSNMEQQAVQEGLFSFVAGNISLELVNTVNNYNSSTRRDKLLNYSYLVEWARGGEVLTQEQARELTRRGIEQEEEAEQVLARARLLRDNVHAIFTAVALEREPETGPIEGLNSELGNAMAHAVITTQDGRFGWDWKDMGETLDCLLWPVARSAAELLVSDQVGRVRECAGDTCGWLFVDTTRNHSRQWCDMRDCGNQAKARRHYHKTKEDKS